MKTPKTDALFFDKETYENSLNELNIWLSDATYLAEQWNSAGNLPQLTSNLFQSWVNNPGLIFELYQKEVDRKLDEFWPGASKQKKAGNEMFELRLENPGKVNRLLETLRNPIHSRQDVFVSIELISFKNGKPFISEGAKQSVKAKCTIQATPETTKLFNDLEAFCSRYNDVVSYIEAKLDKKIHLSDFRGIKLEDGRLSPDGKNLVKELFHKQDGMFRHGISPGVSASDTVKAPKVPAGFKLEQEGD